MTHTIKITAFALLLTLSMTFASLMASPSENNASWAAYCKAFNVDPDNATEEEINYYLDAWRGSVNEEKALETL